MNQPSKIINQETLIGEDYIEICIQNFLLSKKAERLAKGTLVFYKERLDAFIKYLATQEIKFVFQITSNNIREFLLYLEEVKEHNPGGVHTYFRVLKTFLRWHWEEMEIESTNPISKVKAPKLTVEPIQGITREEFESLLSECSNNDFLGERDKAILKVLLDTGVRASELCNINIEDVNLIHKSILITKGKGRKPRFVFFGKSTKRQIKKYLRFRKASSVPLFTNRSGDRLIYNTLRQIIRRLSLKAGLQGIGLHDFRRAFCLECLNKGIPETTIARLMGHTTTQLIGRYAKQTSVDLMNSYRSIVDD